MGGSSMKKILKWIGIVIGAIVLLVVLASVAIMLIVDKDMIASQMEGALNRHVTIGDISVGIFSVISGIEVEDVKISNFKSPERLEALQGKPVAENDLFVGLKAFRFRVSFLPLLSKRFVLRELVLYEPKINVIKYRSGAYNFDDLITPGKGEEVKEEKKEAPSKPFTADDLPVGITIGKVGVERGVLTYIDSGLGQTFQVYGLTVLVHSIEIDPDALDKKNSVGLRIGMGIKTVGKVQTGSVKSFDIGFAVNGKVIPFDRKTRIANPEISARVGLPYGNMTGLMIFEKIKSIDALAKYSGKLDFLKKDITWKNAHVNVWYKGGTAKLSDGRIKTDDFELEFGGMTNIHSKTIGLDVDMTLDEKHGDAIKSGIEKNARKVIKGKVKDYVKAESVAETAFKRLVNDEGRVYLRYRVSGTLSDPDTKLLHPRLPSLGDMVADAAGGVKDIAKEKAKDAGKKVADEAQKKLKKKLKKFKF